MIQIPTTGKKGVNPPSSPQPPFLVSTKEDLKRFIWFRSCHVCSDVCSDIIWIYLLAIILKK